jgi:polyphenol oxidase
MENGKTLSEKPPSVRLETASLLTREGFRHGFSTRTKAANGANWNFAWNAGDAEFSTARSALLASLGADIRALHEVQQVHGAAVHATDGLAASTATSFAGASAQPRPQLEADAIIGRAQTGATYAIAIRVADCVPILLADRQQRTVAAVHAGWKGVRAEILLKSLNAMATAPASIIAAVGPCIGACCFEVDVDVAAQIVAASSQAATVRASANKAWVDLRAAVAAQLVAAGVPQHHIEQVGGCTRCDSMRYDSYRRDSAESGRQVGVIVAG